ncbi:MAG: bifunctional methylenetetrahydrofolate dehydrogenase/methenyltetrahydrofolate cyclohydrolase FolD [Actinomycetota bacterium]
MTARIIDGKAIASALLEEMSHQVDVLKKLGIVPGLAAVLVGDDPGSATYVAGKERDAHSIGMASFVHRLAASATQHQLLALVARLNTDPAVHGIIVQMPLPGHLDAVQAQEALDPAKDVDGLHPATVGLLTLGRPSFVPCTPRGIQVLLEASGIPVAGSHVVVVGRSQLVGRPVSILLSNKVPSKAPGAGPSGGASQPQHQPAANATVTLCHTATVDLASYTRNADIVIVAAGFPGAVTGDMLKPGATVIDVGITRGPTGKLVGDVDFESAVAVAGAITPVPGGVGPMTRAMLMANTIQAATPRIS